MSSRRWVCGSLVVFAATWASGCGSGIAAIAAAGNSSGSSGSATVQTTPTVSLDVSLTANSDGRAGIPIRYEVRDAQGDQVQIVFQWLRAAQVGDPDLELPTDRTALLAILADPIERQRYQVATELGVVYEGRVGSTTGLAPTQVRLPELGGSAVALTRAGLRGLELELLRAGSTPRASGATAFTALHGVVPFGNGTRAWALDETTGGGWRVVVVELATGEEVDVVATSPTGRPPMSLAVERNSDELLVVDHLGGDWRLHRIVQGPAGGVALQTLFDSGPPLAFGGTAHGVASLGTGSAVLTAGDSIVRVPYGQSGVGTATVVLEALADPRGLVVDPFQPGCVYVAERDLTTDTGRVVHVDLVTRAVTPLRDADGDPFPNPLLVGVDPGHRRVVAVCEVAPGSFEVRETTLQASMTSEVALATLTRAPSHLALGPSGLLALSFPAPEGGSHLWAGGGVEQSRTLVTTAIGTGPQAYDPSPPATWRVTASEPFDPAPRAAQPWRIRQTTGSTDQSPKLTASPDGTPGTFVWDSGDVPGGGPIVLRATPVDVAVGAKTDSGTVIDIRASLDVDPEVLSLAGQEPIQSIALGDLDSDGDLDLAAYGGGTNELALFFQDAQGLLGCAGSGTCPDLLVDIGQTLVGVVPRAGALAVGDVDDDGEVDLVAVSAAGVEIRYQDSSAIPSQAYAAQDQLPVPTGSLQEVGLADVDCDGLLDVLATSLEAGAAPNRVRVWRQLPNGGFSAPAVVAVTNAGPAPGGLETLSVATGDRDGDGLLDLFAVDGADEEVEVFRQNGANGFDAFETIDTSAALPMMRPSHVLATDLDGDGLLDLIVSSHDGNVVGVLWQDDLLGFGAAVDVIGTTTTLGRPTRPCVADLNDDGFLDLVLGNRGDFGSGGAIPSVPIFFQRPGPSTFLPLPDLRLGSGNQTPQPASLAVADVDADGALDIVSGNWGAPGMSDLSLFLQQHGTQFDSAPFELDDLEDLSRPQLLELGDIDADGLPELVSANRCSHTTTLWKQALPGSFVPVADTVLQSLKDPAGTNCYSGNDPDARGPFQAVPGDLNNDGRIDVAVVNQGADTIEVFFQSDQGAFDEAPVPGQGDLVLRLGEPDGSPGCQGTNCDKYLPRFLQLADVNGDSALDILVATTRTTYSESVDDTIAVWVQGLAPNGAPFSVEEDFRLSFSPGASPQRPWSFVVSDLDADGTAEIGTIYRESGTSSVVVWTLTGPNPLDPNDWSPLPLSGQATNSAAMLCEPHVIRAADLNADGAQDLVVYDVGGGCDSEILMFLQDPDPGAAPLSFETYSLTSVSGLVSGAGSTQNSLQTEVELVVHDLDEDGDVDLAFTTGNGTIDVMGMPGPTGVLLLFQDRLEPVGNLRVPRFESIEAFTDPAYFSGRPTGLVIDDIDLDGDDDMAVGIPLREELLIFFGNHEIGGS